MYFKDLPLFLYDFNYGNGVTKTTVVADITRNVRVRKDILANVAVYDEYDIIDGETPEIISEKFYGTPEYHWVIMLANEKYDWTSDFPMAENELVKHIATAYNPILYSDDWYWKTQDDGQVFIYIRITSTNVPFELDYLNAPVKIKLSDLATGKFVKYINYPEDYIVLDEPTQYFYFPYNEPWDITQFGKGDSANGVGTTTIKVETEGRENNPVRYIDQNGFVVNPDITNPLIIPLTGAEEHRRENDAKRRIKIISPSLIEVVMRNYEELLK